MAIDTNAAIINGYFGLWKTSKNGKSYFVRKGKAVHISAIEESLETDDVYLKLVFDYLGKTKALRIPRENLSDPALMKILAKKGGAGSKDSYSCLVDTLLQQEEDFEESGNPVTPVYENLGWIKLPMYDDNSNLIGHHHCFRTDHLHGHCEGIYIGTFEVASYGSYDVWKQMVIDEIVPTPVLQLVLVAALSAVVLGLIAQYRSCENPIIHLCYASGKGKSTALEAACSTAGLPFEGERCTLDEDGQPMTKHSLFQSWSSTDNALITSQAGNRGMVTILNELGKSLSSNMTRLVFDLSEGSDKKRLSKNLSLRISEGYTTVFISCGESSLLDRCKAKYEGLRIRVMEINQPITTSAKQARRIKSTCREHGGFAAGMLADFIIEQGGINYLLPIYDRWMVDLEEVMTSVNSKERFIEKFAALFMTTAEIATEALGIQFDLAGLQEFLRRYDEDADTSRSTSASSYDMILEQCRINSHRFFVRNDKSVTNGKTYLEQAVIPKAEIWGRITNKLEVLPGNRVITQEFEVRQGIVEQLLRENGFSNKKTCIEAWKSAGVLDYMDDTHPCYKRKIDPSAPTGTVEQVYVFRVFCSPEDAPVHIEAIQSRKAAEEKRNAKMKSPLIQLQNRALLMATDNEEGGGEDAHTKDAFGA